MVLVATLFTWAWTLLVVPFGIVLPFVGETVRGRRIGLGLSAAIIPLVLSSLWSFMHVLFADWHLSCRRTAAGRRTGSC